MQVVSNQTKLFVVTLFVLLALTLSWQPAAAGGSDPTPAPAPAGDPAGKTTCGTQGDATTNLTVRWTNVYSAPAGTAVTDINMPHDTQVTMTGRDVWGCWVRVESSFGNGWLPIDALSNTGVLGLPVIGGGASAPAPGPVVYSDSRVCGQPGNTTAASTTRWTDMFSWASPDTRLAGKALSPNTGVTIEGRDFWGCWVRVSGGGESGWVPVDSLSARGVMSLPVLADNSNGCTLDGTTISCP